METWIQCVECEQALRGVALFCKRCQRASCSWRCHQHHRKNCAPVLAEHEEDSPSSPALPAELPEPVHS